MSLQEFLQRSSDIIATMAKSASMAGHVDRVIDIVTAALRARRAVLVCGNGGSAADALHISAELVGRFKKERPAFKCIALCDNPAVITAWANDYNYDTVFARQVDAFGEKDGVFWGISTSGNSPNVLAAIAEARKKEMTVIGMVGLGGGKMAGLCDVLLEVPSKDTPLVQQGHVCLYHYICQKVEENLVS